MRVREALELYRRGEVTAAVVVSQIQPPPHHEPARLGEDSEGRFPHPDSFDEVLHAYYNGELTDQQYGELFRAATEAARAGG